MGVFSVQQDVGEVELSGLNCFCFGSVGCPEKMCKSLSHIIHEMKRK